MLKMFMRRTFIILLLLALTCVPAAHATLSSTAFGFPTMSQFTNSIAFNNCAVNAFDLESADFSPFGSAVSTFPSIGQTGVQGQTISAIDFSQNTVISAFSYPAVDTGLGFAGFGDFNGLGHLGHLF